MESEWPARARRGRQVTAGELWPPLWKPSARKEEVNQGSPREDERTPMCCHHSKVPSTLPGAGDTAAAAQGTRHRLRAAASGR